VLGCQRVAEAEQTRPALQNVHMSMAVQDARRIFNGAPMSAFRRLSAHRSNLAMGAVMETWYVRMGLTLLASISAIGVAAAQTECDPVLKRELQVADVQTSTYSQPESPLK
jgi:hypothetical protein